MGQIPRLLLLAGAAAATVGVVLALENGQFLAIGIVAVLVCLMVVATCLHHGAAVAMKEFMEQPLHLEVWGAPLCGEAGQVFRLEKVHAFGAGLLIWVKSDLNGQRVFIKVAQPRDVQQRENGVAIGRAKYVQVNKSTVKMAPGFPAISLSRSAQTEELGSIPEG
jgi:hypothetical protein